MIKLISVDLDGTLLNGQGTVDPDTADSVARVQERGVEIVVNTGRDYPSARRIAQEGNIRGGIICCNGSASYDGEGRQLSDHPLPLDVVKRVERILAEEGFILSYFTYGGEHMLLNLQEYQSYFKKVIFPMVLGRGRCTADAAAEVENWWKELHFCSREQLEQEKIYKLNAICYGREEAAARAVKRLQSSEDLTATCTNMGDMEITMPRIDKGRGLMEYAKARGIAPDEIIVIGDSENDLPALLLPGVHSVAMGNAKDTIRRRCKYVTAGNGEGGVKMVLDGLINQM